MVTIYEAVVSLVEPSYIVGPPLAGGLPGAASLACRALALASGNASGAGPTLDDAVVSLVEPSYIVGPPLAGGLPGAASLACRGRRRWPAGGGVAGLPAFAPSEVNVYGKLFQPELLFLLRHAALLDGLGEALFLLVVLFLAARRLTRLAAVERQGGLAVAEQGGELVRADLEEAGEAFKLALAQAGQFDDAILELFPHIHAQAQALRRVDQRQAALRPQFAQRRCRHLRLPVEDALKGRLVGALRQGQQILLRLPRLDCGGRVARDKIYQHLLRLRVVEQEVHLRLRVAS